MNFYPDGLGYPTLTGDDMLSGPLYTHGDVWYCDSANPASVDGAQPASNKQIPFVTLAYAVTVVTAGDIIVLAPTHHELLAAACFIPQGCIIVGAGNTNGVPDARITVTGVNGCLAPMFMGGGYYCQVRNIHFCASTATPATGYYLELGGDMRLQGCQFDAGPLEAASCVTLNNNPTWASYVKNCKFLVTGHVHATGVPTRGLYLPGACDGRYLQMTNVIFDGGTDGYSVAGCDLSEVALEDLHAWDVTMTNGADMNVHADTIGFIHNLTCTGGSKVTW